MLRADALKAEPLPALSFAVAKGECLAVEGPSGSGKTRLLKAIADLEWALGHVYLDGAERNEMPAPEWRRLVRYASFAPVWWTQTARDAMELSRPGSADRLHRLLATLALEPHHLDKPVRELASGEQHRLALVRALVDDPTVLLLDNPTGGLDPQLAALVEELLRYQVLAGRCVIIAGHDRALFDRLAHTRLQLARPAPRRAGGAP